MDGEQPIEDALPVWRSLLEKRGRHDLAQRLTDYNGYKTLIQKGGPDAFNAARPNLAEMVDLNKNKPEWYELLMRWMVECVGIADPVVIWTLRNSTTTPLTLSSVDYNVLDVSQVRGGGQETIEPIDVAPHDLDHFKGVQSRLIIPRIKIPPGDEAMVRIRYRMDTTESGYTWLIQPTFRTLEGINAIGPHEHEIERAEQIAPPREQFLLDDVLQATRREGRGAVLLIFGQLLDGRRLISALFFLNFASR
jgi:hypothetical protein